MVSFLLYVTDCIEQTISKSLTVVNCVFPILGHVINTFIWFISWILTFFFGIFQYGLEAWGVFFKFSSPVIQSVRSAYVKLKEVALEVKNGVDPGRRWWVRLLFYYSKKIILLVYFFIEFFVNAFFHLLILFLLSIVWYFVGYPYVLYIEENPSLVATTLDQIIRGFGAIINFVVDVYMFLRAILNPVLPLLWMLCIQTYKFSAMLAFNIAEKAGFPVGIDTSVGGRNLKENPLFTYQIENGAFPVGKAFTEYYEIIWSLVFTLLEILFTIIYIIAEIFVKIALQSISFFSLLIKLIIFVPCTNNNFGCTLKEFFGTMFGFVLDAINEVLKFFGVAPLKSFVCTDGDLIGIVPCTCSLRMGGIFSGMSACSVKVYNCVRRQKESGEYYWEEYANDESKPVATGSVMSRVCTRSSASDDPRTNTFEFLDGGNDRDRKLRMLIMANSQNNDNSCYIQCVGDENTHSGWKFKICGTIKTYIGICSLFLNTGGGISMNTDLYGILGVQHPREFHERHLQGYIEFSNELRDNLKMELNHNNFIPDENKQIELSNEKYEKVITKSVFGQIIQYITQVETSDIESRLQCSSAKFDNYDFKSSTILSDLLFDIYCVGYKLYKVTDQEKNNLKRKLKEDSKEDLTYLFTVWDRESDDAWNPDGTKITNEEKVKERGVTFIEAYGKPMLMLSDLMNSKGGNFKERLDRWHEALYDAHYKYTGIGSEQRLFLKKEYRNLWSDLARNVSRSLLSRNDDELFTVSNEIANLHDLKTERRLSIDSNRRKMAGITGSFCGENGYLCPNGECDNTPTGANCKWCDKVTIGCSVLLVPHLVENTIGKIDFIGIFSDLGNCWNEIVFINEDINPVRVTMARGNINSAKFCFPLIKPLPPIPNFSWSLATFIENSCAGQITGKGIIQPCVCPQYFDGNKITDYTSQIFPGAPFSVYARFYNTYIPIQFGLTRIIPRFLAALWYTFVVTLFCSPGSCPVLEHFFDAEYASYGLSFDQNLFCILIHPGSITFTLFFFIYPFYILLMFASNFIWELITIVLDPPMYGFSSFVNFLTLINYSNELDEHLTLNRDTLTGKFKKYDDEINQTENTNTSTWKKTLMTKIGLELGNLKKRLTHPQTGVENSQEKV